MPNKRSTRKVSLTSESEEQTKALAGKLGRQLKAGDIILLEGELGSGKTTFVKGVAQALKVRPRKVHSPTFVLMNYYKGKLPIYHFDLYRLETPQAVETLDLDDYFFGEGVSMVEWPQRLGVHRPKICHVVTFQHKGEHKRRICISYPLKPQPRSSR